MCKWSVSAVEVVWRTLILQPSFASFQDWKYAKIGVFFYWTLQMPSRYGTSTFRIIDLINSTTICCRIGKNLILDASEREFMSADENFYGAGQYVRWMECNAAYFVFELICAKDIFVISSHKEVKLSICNLIWAVCKFLLYRFYSSLDRHFVV